MITSNACYISGDTATERETATLIEKCYMNTNLEKKNIEKNIDLI